MSASGADSSAAGRAGGSLAGALGDVGGRSTAARPGTTDLAGAAAGVDLLVIAVPDACRRRRRRGRRARRSDRRRPPRRVARPRRRWPPTPAAPCCTRSCRCPTPPSAPSGCGGAWFGLAVDGDPLADEVVAALGGQPSTSPTTTGSATTPPPPSPSNHLVGLLGQVERVAALDRRAARGLPRPRPGPLDNVAALGPAAALTGPVQRGDEATVERHLAALPEASAPPTKPCVDRVSQSCCGA